jgi:hypothetical protein
MNQGPRFDAAYPFQENILALPVKNLDAACAWFAAHFGMAEVERFDSPFPTVVMERDGVRLGFAVNGSDPEQDGAAIRVTGAAALMEELRQRGVDVGASLSARARSCRCSSPALPTGCASTSTSPSVRPDRPQPCVAPPAGGSTLPGLRMPFGSIARLMARISSISAWLRV